MKTRTGFVSNSSSSSFIVVFENDPSDVDNLALEMGECESDYDSSYCEVPCKERVVERVHSDINDKMPATIEELMDEIESDMYWELDRIPNMPKYDDFRDPNTNRIDWPGYEEAKQKVVGPIVAKKVENLKKEFKDHFIYILDYADDGGEAAFEHGNIFRNLKYCQKVSHH